MATAARVLRVEDWVPGAAREMRPPLKLVSETMTAGDIIAARVAAECKALDIDDGPTPGGEQKSAAAWLVIPGRTESALNGAKRVFGPGTSGHPPDPASQIAVARKGLESGEFVMLFDGRQIDGWDERITIREDSLATFIKLVPLRGG